MDRDPEIAAQYQCDKHVVKMILETAQLLSTAHRVIDEADDDILYRKTHQNHPCAIWVRESSENYNWAYKHFVALCDEYTFRYGKIHLTEKKLKTRLSEFPKSIRELPMSAFRLAMNSNPECITDDPVESYRKYYSTKIDKFKMIWTKRSVPAWFEAI